MLQWFGVSKGMCSTFVYSKFLFSLYNLHYSEIFVLFDNKFIFICLIADCSNNTYSIIQGMIRVRTSLSYDRETIADIRSCLLGRGLFRSGENKMFGYNEFSYNRPLFKSRLYGGRFVPFCLFAAKRPKDEKTPCEKTKRRKNAMRKDEKTK